MARGEVYIFTGPEIGERQEALDELRASIIKKTGTPPEEQSFYVGETAIADILSVIRNGSLFSEVRLFILKNCENLKKKEDIEPLVKYCEYPHEDTYLILLSDEISIDRNIENVVPRDHRRVFWELFENRKQEWVQTFFRREGFSIEPAAIETILELVENNTDALRQECSRLCLVLDKNQPITAERVESYLIHNKEESPFTLFSHLARGNLAKSLETLHSLLNSKESIQALLAGLLWCFRKLENYLVLEQQGLLSEGELKKIGLSSRKSQEDYRRASKNFTLPQVHHIIALLAKTDVEIRMAGSPMESLLMELLLYSILKQNSNNIVRSRYGRQ
ncbi:MAG: DNA polymerase III subunit delta [Treponemataceae bacterium]|nr:DNA polymerase III subunit delta [Treponemataceae bacterium]